MQAWKCSICKEIFYGEQPMKHCPKCNIDGVFMEKVTELEPHEYRNTDQHYVIIGTGIAGISAAKTLRDLDKGCRIDLFTMESDLPYDRRLINQLITQKGSKDITLYPQSWYDEHHIHLHVNEEIIRMDTKQRCLYLLHEQTYTYDDLILAMGAHPYLPDIPHHDLDKIYPLHTMEDIRKIIDLTQKARRIVIVGGGMQGIETACALADQHIEVDLIEANPMLMAKQFDALGNELLMRYLQKHKVNVYTNAQIKMFHGLTRVETVELMNGKCIDCDGVIFCAGKRASLSLLKGTPIHSEKAIVVDTQMRTNIEHVYACGDVITNDTFYDGTWMSAKQQGQTAAYAIHGLPCIYTPVPQAYYFEHEEFRFFMIGNIHQMDQKLEVYDETQMTYAKYCYCDGICSGALLINQSQHVAKALHHFQTKGSFLSGKDLL